MTKHNLLSRVVLLSLVIIQSAAFNFAHAGSIVINNPPQPQPKKLSVVEDGLSYETELTWLDLKVSAGIKLWLDERFGSTRSDYPYLIDRQSQTVSILIDRATGRYEIVSFEQLQQK